MRVAVTVWRLRDPGGHPATCTVAGRNHRWDVLVRRGGALLIAERYPTDDEALGRVNEIWQTYRELGWTEPRH